MIKEVKAGKTLLINGPASVRLVSGEAEMLGAPLEIGETIVIRDGKRAPFYVTKQASFYIVHASNSIIEEAHGDTVPASWQGAAEKALSLEKPGAIMIIGDVDSGKTSICTFLVNKALKARQTVAVIDADLGQSDIGPPTTIGLAHIRKPLKDLFHVEAEDACFVGFTSPSGAEERVVKCICDFKNRIFERGNDILVINTDGWVESDEAIQYKTMLMEMAAPDVVIGMQQKTELEPILSKLKKPLILTVEIPAAIRKRDKERRKAFRELSYRKYLRNAKVEAYPLNWIKMDRIHSSQRLFLTNERLGKIEEIFGMRFLFCEETTEAISVVMSRSQKLDFEKLQEAEEVFHKKLKVIQKGDEAGLIVGLHDEESKFLGLGILLNIDYRRKILKVSTSVTQEVATICVGNVRLDDAFREIGTAGF